MKCIPPYRKTTSKARGLIRRISVVIPVYREREHVNEAISHLRRQGWPGGLEVIVVDGEQSGTTLRAIRDAGVKTAVASGGRGAQMNAGAASARGEMLLFLHADTRLPPNGLSLASDLLVSHGRLAGAFLLGIASPRPALRAVAAVANVRSRLMRIPYGDQALFFRTEIFHAAGGFRNIPIMEDVELMRRLRRMGIRIGFVNARVSTSARRWHREGVVYTTLRNWTLLTLFWLGVSPRRLARYYRPLA